MNFNMKTYLNEILTKTKREAIAYYQTARQVANKT